MAKSLSERYDELYVENQEHKKSIHVLEERIRDLESGEALRSVVFDRARLIQFARECARWSATSCQCGDRAIDALEELKIEVDELPRRFSAAGNGRVQ